MSTTLATCEHLNATAVDAPATFWSELSARFYRFLGKLPEHHDDIDVEVLKRVPMPL